MSDPAKATKGPITAPPLRAPGQSLADQVQDLFFDEVVSRFTYAIFFAILAGLEWWDWFFKLPPMPWLYTALAAVFAAWAYWKLLRVRPQIRAMKLGLEGERVVGQFLEDARRQGYSVLHDIIMERPDGLVYNVDHVLIGPGGVFVCETKTRSKPATGDPLIGYDGNCVTVDGGPPDEHPVRQARSTAAAIRNILHETTGHKDIPIRPVVLFPGWYITGRSSGRDVWVLNPRALPGFLDHEAPCLPDEDIALYTSRLTNHVREFQKRQK